MAQQQPSVVHVASHAVFTGDPRTSFLLTHGGQITLDRMAEVVVRLVDDEGAYVPLGGSKGDNAAGLGVNAELLRLRLPARVTPWLLARLPHVTRYCRD